MEYLSDISAKNRLFTYKVMFDGGNAPNPYGGICTLAICKPKIRSVANVGDVIIGFAPGNEGRVVYCMVISEVKSWGDYIESCNRAVRGQALAKKIPLSSSDQGDCIWKSADLFQKALSSWSKHDDSDFETDVLAGKNVLLANQFWYFGDGTNNRICVPKELHKIIPGRGHRSNSNSGFRDGFVRWFNESLRQYSISKSGLHGTPSKPPTQVESPACSKCRAEQKMDDAIDEQY
jgi:hypothetical protein